MHDTPCIGKTHLFFAPHNERPNARDQRVTKAVALCKVCPVADKCLQYAQDNNEQFGIWGGVVFG